MSIIYRFRLEERNEPIFYMNEPLIDEENDLREEMIDSTDAVSELTELVYKNIVTCKLIIVI